MSAEDAANAVSQAEAYMEKARRRIEAYYSRQGYTHVDDETRATEAAVVPDPRNLQAIDCPSVQEALVAYVDGEIEDAGVRAAITEHLAGCADCSAALDETRGVSQMADAWQIAGETDSIKHAQES